MRAMGNNQQNLTPGRRKKVAEILADIMANAGFNPPLHEVPDPRGERHIVRGNIGQNIRIDGILARSEAIEQAELCLQYCDPDNHKSRRLCTLWLKGHLDEQQASHVAIFSPTLPEIKLPETPGVSVVCIPDESPNVLVDQIYQAVADSKQQVAELEKLATNRHRVAALLKFVEIKRVDVGDGNFVGRIGANITCAGSQSANDEYQRMDVELRQNGQHFADIGLKQGTINQLWLSSAQYQDDGWHTKVQEALDSFYVFHARHENPNIVVEEVCDIVEQSMQKDAMPKLQRFNFPWHKNHDREK